MPSLKRLPIDHPKNLRSVEVNVGAGHRGLTTSEHYQRRSNKLWRGESKRIKTTADPTGRSTGKPFVTSLPGGLTPAGKKTATYSAAGVATTAYGAAIHHDYKKSKVKKSMSTSVWGVDHGAEVSKAFKPVLGAKPNKQVQNGLKMVQSMPRPVKPPMPPNTTAGPGSFSSRLGARKKFGAGNQSALGNRIGKSMGYDLTGSHKKEGLAFAKPGARKRISQDAGRNAGFFSPKATHRKENWQTYGRSARKGAMYGTGGGALIGGAVGGLKGAAVGAGGGAYLGVLGGGMHGGMKVQNRAVSEARHAGLKRGDLKRVSSDKVSMFGGEKKKK